MERDDQYIHLCLTNGHSEDGSILSEERLRELSKSLSRSIPKDALDLDQQKLEYLRSRQRDLLRTASATGLSPKYVATALNALCSLQEQCNASTLPELQQLCCHTPVWIEAFDLFLRRSESNKAKPVRRLLLSLTSLLSRIADVEDRKSLVQHALTIIIRTIQRKELSLSVKSGVQALDHFIQQSITDADVILSLALSTDCTLSETPLPLQVYKDANYLGADNRASSDLDTFVLDVLEWVQYPDCAGAVGRFLATFFKSLRGRRGQSCPPSSVDEIPFWIYPVKEALKRRPSLLEVYEHHVLPDLLRLGDHDAASFLKTLHYKDIERGNSGSASLEDIHLSLLLAKISSDSRLALEVPGLTVEQPIGGGPFDMNDSTRKDSDLKERESGTEVSADAVSLGLSLLEHSSPNVRIAALGLVVSPGSATAPISLRVLDRLRICVPFFHIEVDSKTRNEFVALMKRFCTRLRGVTMSLLKECKYSATDTSEPALRSEESGGDEESDEDSLLPEEVRMLLRFRRWYMVFLLDELRPTASYPAHITALKILKGIFEAEYAGRSSLSKANNNYFHALAERNPRDMHLRPFSDLIMDPFDDVRQLAAELYAIDLKLNLVPPFPSHNQGDTSSGKDPRVKRKLQTANRRIHVVLETAERKANLTGRADHADGVGRLYDLLYSSSLMVEQVTVWHDCNFLIVDHLISDLEAKARMAVANLSAAVDASAIHGPLVALRYLYLRRLCLKRHTAT